MHLFFFSLKNDKKKALRIKRKQCRHSVEGSLTEAETGHNRKDGQSKKITLEMWDK